MPALLSLVTSVKDYIEIAHKLVETQNTTPLELLSGNQDPTKTYGLATGGVFGIRDYNEFGAILTYLVLSVKEFVTNFLTFTWLKNLWSLPLVVPDVASAMISEISVLDSYFTNAFSFLENGLSTTLNTNANTLTSATENLVNAQKISQNPALFGFEKFIIGFLNSFFLFLPTSTSHLITLRRFVMQGIEAGFMAGLGTIAGNFVWLASIILGLRFIVIPWLSLDIFRYLLGFLLLVKYLWDSSKELNKTSPQSGALAKNSAVKIFALNFLLALTEQTSIYPFISNMSFGAEGSIIESFTGTGLNTESSFVFFGIHGCYLLGILLGSFSLLQFTVWFWENPAFSLYMWMITSYRVTTSSYYKVLNFVFLYLTMLCAISSIPYFGLDYTVTKPLGLIPQDRIIEQRSFSASGPGEPILPETSFLGVKPTDKNTRIRDGVHARRERWKERLIKYQAFDASLYDQGVYDILTVEDLNYGFDRFWLRRKMRNHQIRFRLFPGPWMRSLKKQLNKPGFTGPRTEFFRILFEQYYHPSFHATANKNNSSTQNTFKTDPTLNQSILAISPATQQTSQLPNPRGATRIAGQRTLFAKSAPQTKKGLISEYSALRKFSRNVNTRLIASSTLGRENSLNMANSERVYSKSLKSLFKKMGKDYTKTELNLFRNLSKNLLLNQTEIIGGSLKKTSMRKPLSKKERLLLISRTNLASLKTNFSETAQASPASLMGISKLSGDSGAVNTNTLNYYFQKKEAFKRKLQYYSTAVTRKFSVGNNAPYFKTILKRAFYYHKPTLRQKRTMFAAAMRRGFRKKSVMPKKLVYAANINTEDLKEPSILTNSGGPRSGEKGLATLENASNKLAVPSQQYSVLGKRASRYRYQIYKDVLQHWYYTPFNRLLLKFDVDSFMNRQPKAQFLTKKEERLLHLRRVLLAEHYNTLRWYTYMQHYRTMKSRIGGTKSFASTVYNQQFQGTFKKIRHLFAITPIQESSAGSILKFDQPLFNTKNKQNLSFENLQSLDAPQAVSGTNSANGKSEAISIKKNSKVNSPSLLTPYKHEDLTNTAKQKPNSQMTTVVDESLNVAGMLLQEEQATKVASILRLKEEKNYAALAALLASPEVYSPMLFSGNDNNRFAVQNNPQGFASSETESVESKLMLLDLLKEAKKRLNDQTFLKNYITHRIDKREQRNKETSKELQSQLQTLKAWLSPFSANSSANLNSDDFQKFVNSVGFDATTGVRKGLNDGVFILNNLNPAYISTGRKVLLTQKLALRQQPNNGDKLTSRALFNAQKLEMRQTLTSINNLSNLVNSLNSQPKLLSSENFIAKSKTILKPELQTFVKTVLKPFVLVQTKLFTKRTEKNLEWWRQKQRALNKRASSRKKERLNLIESNISPTNKTVSNNSQRLTSYLLSSPTELRNEGTQQNLGVEKTLTAAGSSRFLSQNIKVDLIKSEGLIPSVEGSLRKKAVEGNSETSSKASSALFKGFILRKFRKKRARGKHYRKAYFGNIIRPKNASAIPTVSTQKQSTYSQTQGEFSRFVDYYLNPTSLDGILDKKASLSPQGLSDVANNTLLSKDDKYTLFKAFKQKLAKTITKIDSQNARDNSIENETLAKKVAAKQNFKNLLIQSTIKKSPSKKRSRRTWRKRKRQKFSINHDRYRKRQNHGLGKLRTLAKKLKRIKSTQEFQNWWWNTYLPNFIKNASPSSVNSVSPQTFGTNSRYAPLSTAKALDIISRSQKTNNSLQALSTLSGQRSQSNSLLDEFNQKESSLISPLTNVSSGDILEKIYDNLVVENISSKPLGLQEKVLSQDLPPSNPGGVKFNSTAAIPFYAGWDESLRKFVVTNRFLSRRDAGFEVNLDGIFQQTTTKESLEFTNAPIKGLNEASFLYLQTEMPFNSYTIDQFIPNNQSFYAPLGWKRFQFRHSLLKNWQSATRSKTPNSWTKNTENLESVYLTNNSLSNFEYFRANSSSLFNANGGESDSLQKTKAGLKNRRIKKRYKLLRQTPIQLMYVPTGALLTETLPSHYISVFDKQYRFPRNRYIKRSLPKSIQSNPESISTKNKSIADYSTNSYLTSISTNQVPEFTLRKRVKPKRKYHKKRFTKKDGLIFPRRRKFETISASNSTNQNAEQFRLRPSTKANQNISKGTSKGKKQGRNSGKANPIRLRQLRRREFQQVFKPLQRYQPRYGGFTWPGDYLRLQIIPMPQLEPTLFNTSDTSKTATTQTKVLTSPKAKINAQPIGILPRKYLLQKHNLKVFQKKLALKYSLK